MATAPARTDVGVLTAPSASEGMGMARWLEVERQGDVTVLTFRRPGFLDSEAAEAMGVQLLDLVENQGHRRFVLDFGVVTRLSSAMLGTLVTFRKKVKQVGGDITLCSLAPDLYHKFESTKLHNLFRICPNKQASLLALK